MLLLTVVAFGLLVKLGFWQLGRAVEKQQRLERIASGQARGELGLDAYLRLPPEQQTGTRLALEVVTGEQRIWLDNRFWQGQAGYQLLVPVRSVNRDQWWLLNLGWFPRGRTHADWPQLPELPEQVWVSVISVPVTATLLLDSEHFAEQRDDQLKVQTLDLPRLQSLLGQALQPQQWRLQQVAGTEYAWTGRLQWQWVSMPPERHRAYALQWFSLAFVELLVAIAWYVRQLMRQLEERDEIEPT